ncbi:putative methyltransferase [Stanieria sp. NIES-3757]|nr:putative methyltransferase [Stanieria sp. NIES-3757]
MSVDIREDKYHRTFEQLKKTYEAEKELNRKLMNATQAERLKLYTSAYDAYFEKIPDHPMILRKANPEAIAWVVEQRMQLLNHFLNTDITFLEIGPGDCSLSLEVAKYVKKVYAADVSTQITAGLEIPENFELIISDGVSIPVPENSVDVVYSHQLMEHLHPDDAFQQLQNVYHALAPGGIYICITPNRLSGPHDTSAYFDEIATGWHLKEYTVFELYKLFRAADFSKIDYYKSRGVVHSALPLNRASAIVINSIESFLSKLPFSLRRKLSIMMTFRGITIIGTK